MAPTPLLGAEASIGDALAALDGQTARLDLANGRTTDLIAIAEACDRRAAEAAKALAPKLGWRFW